jgi:hypothetical protein
MRDIVKIFRNFFRFFFKKRESKVIFKNITPQKLESNQTDDLIDRPSSIRGRFPRGE